MPYWWKRLIGPGSLMAPGPCQTPAVLAPLPGTLLALGGLALATGMRWALSPVLGGAAPLGFHFLVVIACAWFGGWWPGAIATLLSLPVGLCFLFPGGWLHPGPASGLLALVLFAANGLVISALADSLHRQRFQAQGRAAESERQLGRVREVETELEAANRELGLRNGQLKQSGERKDQFLLMLAHELRNPLAPIRNALMILQQHDRGPTVTRARAIVERQIVHMASLLDDLLDVSRITQGRVELKKTPMELCPCVRSVVEDYQDTARAHGQALMVAVEPGGSWIEADPTRVAQVIANLISNALKFSDPGGHVTVRVLPDPARRYVTVTVTDEGIGIEASMLPAVFEVFAQADRSIDRTRGGLGLGLALVRGLVELHGGNVWVESRGPHQGSTFSFRLPMIATPNEPKVVTNTLPPGAEGRRVLVVEDNRDAAETLRDLLEYSGHTVALAYSGPEGVGTAKTFRPQIVLCDLGLPGMDGYAVARELRGEPELRGLVLWAVTGYGAAEDRERTRAAGFDDHWVKPLDPSLLEARIRALAPPEESLPAAGSLPTSERLISGGEPVLPPNGGAESHDMRRPLC